jgi:uncharacterized membrane protein YpjA
MSVGFKGLNTHSALVWDILYQPVYKREFCCLSLVTVVVLQNDQNKYLFPLKPSGNYTNVPPGLTVNNSEFYICVFRVIFRINNDHFLK